MIDHRLAKALELFALTLPLSRDRLDQTRAQLLHTWNPHRYANHANNPRKYMKMVKQGEAMSQEIERAYQVLLGCVETGSGEVLTEKSNLSVSDPP